MTTPKDVLALAKEHDVEIVDLRFCDLPGLTQHFSVPVSELTEGVFEDGLGFDGSSIRGFQEIQESDMLLVADPDTAYLDPFTQHTTLNIHCYVKDPVTGEWYSRDPRYVARKAELYLKQTGIADVSYWGPEAEFYIFDSIRFDQNQHEGYYHIDAAEGVWNSGAERNADDSPNLGYKPRYKEGYFPVPPMDHYQDLRSQMVLNLEKVGVKIEVHHHEVGTAGQAEIDMRYGSLLKTADNVMKYKYVVKNTAWAGRQDRHVHAEADLPGQRLGDAHPPEPVEGRREPVLGRGRLRRHLGHGALVHRRAAPARAGAPRVHEPDDELVPPARARLRGADQPRVLAAEPRARASGSRCSRGSRPRSAWSSARRTRRATPTSRSARC